MTIAITTSITRLLGIQVPVICAPMAFATGGALAAAVNNGGGFGFIGAGYCTVDFVKNELAIARQHLEIDSQATPLPIGAGFIAWMLDDPESKLIDNLRLALDSRVKAVWFAFANDMGNDMGRWITYVRDYDARLADGHRTLVFVQVNTVEDALLAASSWHADVIVAQGIEAGGHGSASSIPLLTLVPSILRNLPSNGPPVLAAGGMSDGGHLAALLVLGASGIVLGTRFLLTPECLYSDAQKSALLDAGVDATVRTKAFDRLMDLNWPAWMDGRALRNRTVEGIETGVPVEDVRKKFQQCADEGDRDGLIVWAGAGVGLVSSIDGAAIVVKEVHDEANKRLNVSGLLSTS